MAIEKRGFSLNGVADSAKRAKYEHFVRIARDHMNSQEAVQILQAAGLEGYADFYKRCYGMLDKRETEKLGRSLHGVHGIAREIKRRYHRVRELDYSEVLQDFGDNIRRCANPFGLWGESLPESSYSLAKGITQIIYVLYKTKQGAFFIIDCLSPDFPDEVVISM